MSQYNQYAQSAVTGVEWTRAKRVVIANPLAGQPEVRYDEEVVLATSSGQNIHKSRGYLTVPFDPDAVIDIYDPETGEKAGQTITQAEAYGVLFSAYMTAAHARDAANSPGDDEDDEGEEDEEE